MTWVRCTAILACLTVILLPGCQRKDPENQPTDVNNNIVCPMLYQGESLTEALEFIELPEERMDTSPAFVNKSGGGLAEKDDLAFANAFFSLRKSKDAEMYMSMLSSSTRKQLLKDDSRIPRRGEAERIKNGTFLYGEYDFKFFASFRKLTRAELADLTKGDRGFTQKPSHAIVFCHFHKPQYMLIGDSYYLIREKGSYKIVMSKWLGDTPLPVIPKKPSGPKKYGIAAFEQNDDAYERKDVCKYEWDVELKLDESQANTFELLKLTEVVSSKDNIELDPDVAKQIIVAQKVFDKYKYRELKCSFKVGRDEPGGNFGRGLSGWGWSFNIASWWTSGTMRFPGENVTNVKANESGGFVGQDLEFMSFETSKDGVLYRHRVVLRKMPVTADPGS